jgi:hypothetical protein
MQLQAQISRKRDDAEMKEFQQQTKDHDKYCDKCNNGKRCDRRPRLGESKAAKENKRRRFLSEE